MEQVGKGVFEGAAPSAEPTRGRDSLFLAAKMRVVGFAEEMAVRVRNLSAGGLMAELPEPLSTPDKPIEIEVRGIGWVPGRIAWQTEGRVGVAFDREIDPQRARKPVGERSATGSGKRFTAL